MKKIYIEKYSDGWNVFVDGLLFKWNHNDEGLGADIIKELLEHLGHNVEFEEVY